MDQLEAMKADAERRTWKVRVRTRKLASGRKRYFTIEGPSGTQPSTVSLWVKGYFPNAHMTSGSMGWGGPFNLTYAER